jgi:hypothetical protein
MGFSSPATNRTLDTTESVTPATPVELTGTPSSSDFSPTAQSTTPTNQSLETARDSKRISPAHPARPDRKAGPASQSGPHSPATVSSPTVPTPLDPTVREGGGPHLEPHAIPLAATVREGAEPGAVGRGVSPVEQAVVEDEQANHAVVTQRGGEGRLVVEAQVPPEPAHGRCLARARPCDGH